MLYVPIVPFHIAVAKTSGKPRLGTRRGEAEVSSAVEAQSRSRGGGELVDERIRPLTTYITYGRCLKTACG
jgi:hypothetical protein